MKLARSFAVALAAAALAAPASAVAAPNLVTRAVSDPPTAVKVGGAFAVRDAVANTGSAARTSDVRYYLAPDAKRSLAERKTGKDNPRVALGDVLMGGFRKVPALARGARSAAPRRPRTIVAVPYGTRPGLYYLLACADDRGAVAESAEHDNCRPAKKRVRVTDDAPAMFEGTFIDIAPEVPRAEDIADLERAKPLACMTLPAGKALTKTQAIASARAYLTRVAGADAMAGFASSAAYRNVDQLQGAAAAAIAAGKPGAALAALLRAHDLAPREASHLANAGVVATSIGLPREGLALMTAAQRLDDPDATPMGLSRSAIALANRGYALAMAGRPSEAVPALKAALEQSPALAEAARTLTGAELCKSPEDALPYALRGRLRFGPKPIDMAQGQESQLRKLILPPFPQQADRWFPYYRGLTERFLAETTASVAKTTSLDVKIRARTVTRAESNRRAHLMGLIYDAGEAPAIQAQRDDVNRLLTLAQTTREEFFGGGTGEVASRYSEFVDAADAACVGQPSTCFASEMRARCRPGLRIAHQTWLDQIQEAYDVSAARHRAVSRRMSAFAAHLADPDAHARAMQEIVDEERAAAHGIVGEIFTWTHDVNLYADYCVEPDPPAADPDAPGAPAAAGNACSPFLAALSGVNKLGPLTVKINCEKIEIGGGIESGLPWLEAFGEIVIDPRAGSLTIVGGSAGKVGAGPLEAGFKSGLYVTLDNDGFKDVGWRTGPSATIGAGPLEFEAYKDEIDLTFVGAMDYLPWK